MEYNSIVRGPNNQILGKVLLADLKHLPSTWKVTYGSKTLSTSVNLHNLLCDNKFPLSIHIHTDPSFKDEFSVNILLYKSTSNDDVYGYRMDKNQTVKELKRLIQAKQDIPVNQQRLKYGRKFMDDCRMLKEYIFPDEDTMFLTMSTGKGGEEIPTSVELEEKPEDPNLDKEYVNGLNPIGKCPNNTCTSRKSTSGLTVHNQGYCWDFWLNLEKNFFPCSTCSTDFFTPTNFIVRSARALFRLGKAGYFESDSSILESFGCIDNSTNFDLQVYDLIEIRTVKKDESVYFCLKCDKRIMLKEDEVLKSCLHPVHRACMEEGGCEVCEAKLMTWEEFKGLIEQYQPNSGML